MASRFIVWAYVGVLKRIVDMLVEFRIRAVAAARLNGTRSANAENTCAEKSRFLPLNSDTNFAAAES